MWYNRRRPIWGFTRVKVGLVTSAVSIPSAAQTPFTKIVLPAPNGPLRRRISPPFSRSPICRPKLNVSSSDELLNSPMGICSCAASFIGPVMAAHLEDRESERRRRDALVCQKPPLFAFLTHKPQDHPQPRRRRVLLW